MNRDNLPGFLRSKNIEQHYIIPNRSPSKAYARRIEVKDLTATENFYKNLTLPPFPELSLESVDMIISIIQDWRNFNNLLENSFS